MPMLAYNYTKVKIVMKHFNCEPPDHSLFSDHGGGEGGYLQEPGMVHSSFERIHSSCSITRAIYNRAINFIIYYLKARFGPNLVLL